MMIYKRIINYSKNQKKFSTYHPKQPNNQSWFMIVILVTVYSIGKFNESKRK